MTAYANQHKFSGNVLIAQKGEILFQKAYGYANLAQQRPNTLETEFRVGSLTKMFTSTAILQLMEAGKLSLTDPIKKFLPDFPDGDKIQIQHLLSHTSGIRGYTAAPPPTNLEESISHFQFDVLGFTPGTQFEYNNYNYLVLSSIIEQLAGKKLPEVLQQQIFAKAALPHSGLDYAARKSADKAEGYMSNPAQPEWEQADDSRVAIASGAGALYTTIGDLYQWSKAISTEKILPKAALNQAWTVVQGNYGLGWIVNDVNGKKEVGHTGSIEGFIAALMYYPVEDITIVFLSNYGGTNGQQVVEDLRAVTFGEPYSLPQQKQEIALSEAILNRYVGTYQLNEHFSITVSVEKDKLYALAPGDAEKTELTAEAENKFFIKGPEIEVEFILENEQVKYMFINMHGGQKLTKVG